MCSHASGRLQGASQAHGLPPGRIPHPLPFSPSHRTRSPGPGPAVAYARYVRPITHKKGMRNDTAYVVCQNPEPNVKRIRSYLTERQKEYIHCIVSCFMAIFFFTYALGFYSTMVYSHGVAVRVAVYKRATYLLRPPTQHSSPIFFSPVPNPCHRHGTQGGPIAWQLKNRWHSPL